MKTKIKTDSQLIDEVRQEIAAEAHQHFACAMEPEFGRLVRLHHKREAHNLVSAYRFSRVVFQPVLP